MCFLLKYKAPQNEDFLYLFFFFWYIAIILVYRKFKVGNISYFVKIIIYNLFMCIFQSPQKDWIIFKVSELMLRWFSRFQLFVTLWGIAHQASLSMGFSRQEYWSALPCPPPEDLPGPGIEPTSLLPPALAGGFFTTSTTGKAPLRSVCVCVCVCVCVW